MNKEQKIAEIREKHSTGHYNYNYEIRDAIQFLLDELEKITEQRDELLDEKEDWQVVADRGWHVAGEEAKKNESLQQEIERLREENRKMIEGLRWYAKLNPAYTGHRAHDILKEIGVTVG